MADYSRTCEIQPPAGHCANEDTHSQLLKDSGFLTKADQDQLLRQLTGKEAPKANGSEPDFSIKPDLDAEAKKISGIIEKDGDFHSGLKREQTTNMLQSATEDGTYKTLTDKINADLAADNSQYRLNAKSWSENATYSEDVGRSLVMPQVKTFENPASTTEVVDSKSGEVEDRISSKKNINRPGWTLPDPSWQFRNPNEL